MYIDVGRCLHDRDLVIHVATLEGKGSVCVRRSIHRQIIPRIILRSCQKLGDVKFQSFL